MSMSSIHDGERRGALSLTPPSPTVLFSAALLATFARCLYVQPPVPTTRGEMDAVAIALARTGEFANPFLLAVSTGPTAFVPPLYPFYVSLFVRAFGESGYIFPLALATGLVYALHAALLPLASEAFFGRREPGVWAALVCIAAPVLLWIPHWDALYTATGLMLFAIAALRLKMSEDWRLPAACGVLAGLLALLNPSSLLVTLPLAAVAVWREARRPLVLPVFLAAAILAVAPWVARNHALLRTVSLKTNFGLALYISNNDCAAPSFPATLASGCHDAHNPFASPAEAENFRALGEVAYDRSRMTSAAQWIDGHRSAFARLTLLRVVEFWFPPLVYGGYAVSCWLITLGSLAGLFLLRRRHATFFYFFLAALAAYPAMYYVVVADIRYRYPILWLSLLAFGYLVERVRVRIVQRSA